MQMAKNSYQSINTWFKDKLAEPMMTESKTDATLSHSLKSLLAPMGATHVDQQRRLLERRIAGLKAQALKQGAEDWYVYGLEDLASDVKAHGKQDMTLAELQSYQEALSDLTAAYSPGTDDSSLAVGDLQQGGYATLFACSQVNGLAASAQLAAAAPAAQLAIPTPGN